MTFSLSPQCRAYSRFVMDEKVIIPGVGSMVTNDWRITCP